MIDTDKYEGHHKNNRIWYEYSVGITSDYTNGRSRADQADQNLVADAPLLLAEVKELQAWKKLVSDIVQLEHDGSHLRKMLKELIE